MSLSTLGPITKSENPKLASPPAPKSWPSTKFCSLQGLRPSTEIANTWFELRSICPSTPNEVQPFCQGTKPRPKNSHQAPITAFVIPPDPNVSSFPPLPLFRVFLACYLFSHHLIPTIPSDQNFSIVPLSGLISVIWLWFVWDQRPGSQVLSCQICSQVHSHKSQVSFCNV